MSIISKSYAQRLIKSGKAEAINGNVTYDEREDCTYQIVTRFDAQRTDHYLLAEGDAR